MPLVVVVPLPSESVKVTLAVPPAWVNVPGPKLPKYKTFAAVKLPPDIRIEPLVVLPVSPRER